MHVPNYELNKFEEKIVAGYETDEEQLEALKKWWKENGVSAVAGVVIGLGLMFGWRWWQDYSVQQAQMASGVYEQIKYALDENKIPQARQVADRLLSEYSTSSYAVLAALNLAHHDLKAGDIDTSHARLQWVIDNSSMAGLAHIARLRKARLFLSQNKVEEADKLIKLVEMGQFKVAYAELQGDIAITKNQTEVARTAYIEALTSENLSTKHKEWLQMKLDNLGNETYFTAPAPLSAYANPTTSDGLEEQINLDAAGNPTTAQGMNLIINPNDMAIPLTVTGNPTTALKKVLTMPSTQD